MKRAWPVVTSSEAAPTFCVFLELGGLAASRREPYARIATETFRGWHEWLTTLIDAPTPELRSDEAAVFIALIGGLMLMHLAGEPKMAQQAYRQFTSDARSGR